MKYITFLLILILTFFISCSEEEDEFEIDLEKTADQALSNEEKEEAVKTVEKEVVSDESYVDTSYDSSIVSGDSEKIAQLVRDGEYAAAIEKGANSGNLSTKYWIGIAYYCKMLMDKTYPESTRADFRYKAKNLLQEVAYNAKNDTLKARAHLWLAMLIHLNNVDLKNKRIAIKSLHIIQTTKLKDTVVYNDSLLISANIYRQMGWYIQARRFLKKLRTATAQDDKVFNPETGEFLSCSQAASRGLEKVHNICFAEGAGTTETSGYETTTTSESASEAVISEPAAATSSAATITDTETTTGTASSAAAGDTTAVSSTTAGAASSAPSFNTSSAAQDTTSSAAPASEANTSSESESDDMEEFEML
ncbi:MAG TPA: hypothetical protein VKS21_03110 [Spirochaetota bacterium]|nr:hypothetical protein [Spirochaetota bacterium]